MKPFDIELAKQGKPVCTRDGRKARIVCFDRKLFYQRVSYPILALIERPDGEEDVSGYSEEGKVLLGDGAENIDDLMVVSEKKTGWINIYPSIYEGRVSIIHSCIYKTQKEAKEGASRDCIITIPIDWEE